MSDVKTEHPLQQWSDEFYATASPLQNPTGTFTWQDQWEHGIEPDSKIRIEDIDRFNARGMHCVYGRGDQLGGRQPVFHLDLWKAKDGRLLVRFWSRGSQVDNESLEVFGYSDAGFPPQDERWVPEALRKRYFGWMLSMMNPTGRFTENGAQGKFLRANTNLKP